MSKNFNSSDIYKLYAQYSGTVYAVCMSYLHNSDDAEDIMQDTFVTAMRKYDTLEHPEKAERWLTRIAANKCKDYIKKQKPCLIDDENGGYDAIAADTQTPEQSYDANRTARELYSAVDELPQNQRDVIVGFYFNQQSIKQLAKKLNLSQSAVKSTLHRARKNLKTECERREISLSGIGLYGALFIAGAKQAAETTAAATAGAIAAKIAAGVAAAAIIGYGAVGIATYSDKDSKIDVRYSQEIVDSSPYTHITPQEPILLSNPKDNSDKYEYIDYESISKTVFGTIPLQFIDDTQLLVYVPSDDPQSGGTNYIYDFAEDTLTELDCDSVISEKPLYIQYIDSDDYYIFYADSVSDYYADEPSGGFSGVHVVDKIAQSSFSTKNLVMQKHFNIAYTNGAKYNVNSTKYSLMGGVVLPNFCNNLAICFETNGKFPDNYSNDRTNAEEYDTIYIRKIYEAEDDPSDTDIKVQGYICGDNVRWVDDNTIEYVYAKKVKNGKFVDKKVVRYDIDTKNSCEQTGFEFMYDFGASNRQVMYYDDSVSVYNIASVLDYGANTLTDYKIDGGIESFLRGENIVCAAVNNSAWSSYINTGKFGGNYTVNINRYNIITEQYETLCSYTVDSETPEHYPHGFIMSPNAERIICYDNYAYKMICRK